MKALRKPMSILLVLTMLMTCLPLSVFAAELPFTDVKRGDWFYDAVCYVYENGLMSGTSGGEFSPHVTTSRGMIVTILHSMDGRPAAGNADFADVAETDYYAKAVAWASSKGIVTGYGGGRFGPNDPITREQLAMILFRYAEYKGMNTAVLGDSIIFADRNTISSYAVKAIDWALGFGLISGVGDNRLNPSGSATRAQAAVILMRFNTEEALRGTEPTPEVTPAVTPTPTPAVTPNVTPEPTPEVTPAPAETEGGYAICDMELNDGVAQVLVTAAEDCRLLVAVLTEDGAEVTRATVAVQGGTMLGKVSVSLPKIALPEHFLLCGALLDANAKELCSPYTCRSYTKAYETFSRQKESDYAADRVIDVLDADDGNFAVLQDDVQRIVQTDAVNVLRSRADGVCVFDRADAALRDLKRGDKLLLRDLDGQYAAILVDEINVSDDVVTIAETADTTLADFYRLIKISADLTGRPAALDSPPEAGAAAAKEESTADKEYLGEITFGPAVSNKVETGFGSVSHETSVGGKLEMNYALELFGESYLEFVMLVGITTELGLDVGPNVTDEDEITLVSIPLAGLKDVAAIPAELGISYEIDCEAGLSTTAKVEAVSGLVYHTGDGVQQVEYKEVAMGEMELKGSVEVEIGMRASINAEVFDGKAKATLGMEGGIAIGGEAKAFTAPLPDTAEYHACDLCVDGECHGYFEVEIAAKFEICDWFKGDILDLDLVRVEWFITKFYFSLLNGVESVHQGLPHFDMGDCPNKKYRVTFETYRNGKRSDGTVTVSHGTWGVQKTGSSPLQAYLYQGDYTADAVIGIQTDDERFTVSGSKTVKLEVKDPVLSGYVRDKEDGDAIGGATITLTNGNKTYSATAGSDGHYTVTVEPGSYTITCGAKDYKGASLTAELLKNKTQSFELEKDETLGVVSGTVTDESSGEALSGVTVSTTLPDGSAMTAVTDGSGSYSMELPGKEGYTYTLTFRLETYDSETAEATVIPEETVAVNVKMSTFDERAVYTKYLLNGGYKKLFPRGEKKYAKISTVYGDLDGNGIKDLVLYYADTQWTGPRGYEEYNVLYTIDETTREVVEVCKYYTGGGTLGGDGLSVYRKNVEGEPQLVVDTVYREGIWKNIYGQVTLNYSGKTAVEGDRVLTTSYSTDETNYYKDEIEQAKQGLHYIDSDGYYLRVYTINDEVVTKEAHSARLYQGGGYIVGDEFFAYAGTYDEPIPLR